MLELNKTELEERIAQGGKVVVKVWSKDCSYCTRYAEVFGQVASEHDYMAFVSLEVPTKNNPTKLLALTVKALPATIIFEHGKLKYFQTGFLTKEQLEVFLEDGANGVANLKAQEPVPTTVVNPAPQKTDPRTMPLINLKAAAFDLHRQLLQTQQNLLGLEQLIAEREKHGK